MSPVDMWRCDRCQTVFVAKHAAQDRYLDPLCPHCGSMRLSSLSGHDQRLDAAVADSNRY
jgi:ribosomal protein S27AE